MSDTFSDYPVTPTSPPVDGFSITPSDGSSLSVTTRGIYVGVAGNLKVVTAGGTTLTFVGLGAGMVHPLRVTKVFATDTTADSIIGLV